MCSIHACNIHSQIGENSPIPFAAVMRCNENTEKKILSLNVLSVAVNLRIISSNFIVLTKYTFVKIVARSLFSLLGRLFKVHTFAGVSRMLKFVAQIEVNDIWNERFHVVHIF